jgi:hypothetical protein
MGKVKLLGLPIALRPVWGRAGGGLRIYACAPLSLRRMGRSGASFSSSTAASRAKPSWSRSSQRRISASSSLMRFICRCSASSSGSGGARTDCAAFHACICARSSSLGPGPVSLRRTCGLRFGPGSRPARRSAHSAAARYCFTRSASFTSSSPPPPWGDNRAAGSLCSRLRVRGLGGGLSSC